ncbi:MAG TPA: hypothetical protein VF230_16175, partial [Acidimicrobiales bacterium]
MSLEVERLGIHVGEQVRFLRADRSRWQEGVVAGLERDGSLAVRDAKGASRAVPLDHVLVRTQGARGGRHWEPLLERAA